MFVCSQTSETIYTIILNFFTSFDEVLTPLGGPFFVSLQELEGNWVISLWHFVDPLLMTGFDYSPLVHKINLFISATPTEKIPRESRYPKILIFSSKFVINCLLNCPNLYSAPTLYVCVGLIDLLEIVLPSCFMFLLFFRFRNFYNIV